MEPATEELLRKAAIEALSSREDRAAMELLALIHGRQPQAAARQDDRALPALRPVPDGPPHDCSYWMRVIRKAFIPFMIANGRFRFTSHELFSWIENCSEIQLTTGDLHRQVDGKTVWRDIASNALTNLKRQGVVYAEFRGKSYEIQPPSQRSMMSELEQVG